MGGAGRGGGRRGEGEGRRGEGEGEEVVNLLKSNTFSPLMISSKKEEEKNE